MWIYLRDDESVHSKQLLHRIDGDILPHWTISKCVCTTHFFREEMNQFSFFRFSEKLLLVVDSRDWAAGHASRPNHNIWCCFVVQQKPLIRTFWIGDTNIYYPTVFLVNLFKSQILNVVPNEILEYVIAADRFVTYYMLEAVPEIVSFPS